MGAVSLNWSPLTREMCVWSCAPILYTYLICASVVWKWKLWFVVHGFIVRIVMLTGLSTAEASISEKVSDKQSDPNSESVTEKMLLCIWTRSSSLWVDTVCVSVSVQGPLTRQTHANTQRCILLFMSGGVWGGQLWDAHKVFWSRFCRQPLISNRSCFALLLNMKQKPRNEYLQVKSLAVSWIQVCTYNCSHVYLWLSKSYAKV